jgi:hypothetical protein
MLAVAYLDQQLAQNRIEIMHSKQVKWNQAFSNLAKVGIPFFWKKEL